MKILVLIIILIDPALSSTVFLIDGKIKFNEIIVKSDNDIIETKNTIYKRSEILRILHNDYKVEKQYVYTKDDQVLEVYIVYQDSKAYTFRNDIEGKEYKFPTDEIITISKIILTPKQGIKIYKTKTGAMLRSIVIPGWGQKYQDSSWKHYVYWGIGSVLLSLLSYYTYQRYKIINNYESLPVNTNQDVFDSYYNASKKYTYKANIMISLSLTYYITNLVDVYFTKLDNIYEGGIKYAF